MNERATLMVLKWEGEFPTLVPTIGGLYHFWPILADEKGGRRPFLGVTRLMVVEGGGPDGLFAPAEVHADGRVVVGWPKCLREAEPGLWGRPAEQPAVLPSLKGGVR